MDTFDERSGLVAALPDVIMTPADRARFFASNPASSLTLPSGAVVPKAGQVLWDNFKRPNTPAGQLGSSPTMPPWRMTGPSFNATQIVNGQVTVTGSAGVVYIWQRLRATPRKLIMDQLFVANGTNQTSGGTLICMLDNDFVDDAVHIIFQNDRVIVQKRIGGVSTTVNTTVYPGGAIAPDPLTPRRATVTYNGATVVIVGCDGIQFNVTDPDFATLVGPYAIWEIGSIQANVIENLLVGAGVEFDAAQAYPQFYREIVRADNPLVYLPFGDIDTTNSANGTSFGDDGSGLYNAGNPVAAIAIGQPSLIYGDPSYSMTTDGATAGVGMAGNPAATQLTTGSIECWFSTTEVRTSNRLLVGAFNREALIMVGGVLKFNDPTGGVRDTGIFVADGKSHHIVATFISGVTNGTLVYLDGRLVLTTTYTNVNFGTALGCGFTAGTWAAAATFQHFVLYNYLLSAAQILRHYQIGTGIVADGGQGSTLQLPPDVRQAMQTPTEAVLVSGVDPTLGTVIGPVTLTAARLIGAPLTRIPGRRYTFILVQGGAGGFAVTWVAAYKKTWADTGNVTGARSTISFVDDGTNLNQDGAQAPYV